MVGTIKPKATDIADISNNALIAPANTICLLYLRESAAARRNVLSPISDTKMEENPAKNPAELLSLEGCTLSDSVKDCNYEKYCLKKMKVQN